MDRKFIQDTYIKVCRDSGFGLEWDRATHFVAVLLRISPFQVYIAFACMDRMKSIAAGTDPVLKIDA